MRTSIQGRDPASGESIVIHCADGRIDAIENGVREESAWVSPGLVDLQVNGFRGHDLNADDLTIEAVRSLARELLGAGVTTFVPTLITAGEAQIVRSLRVIAEARHADPMLAHMIPFVHLEGPHIHPEDGPRGAHPREHVRPPDVEEFDRWQAASGNLVGMVTLSPHYNEAPAYIRALVPRGILISLGHTNASPDQVRAAAAAGAQLCTHLGNGIARMLPRHPNAIWAQLAEDRLTATFIADGCHLPADTLTAMLRAKSVSRSILVSDLVALAGHPPGVYTTPVGGSVELHPDGRLTLAHSDYLAGATSPLKDCVAFVANHTGFSLREALQMATVNPGHFTGERGVLRVGAPADLIRFHWEPGASTLTIEEVMLRGAVQTN